MTLKELLEKSAQLKNVLTQVASMDPSTTPADTCLQVAAALTDSASVYEKFAEINRVLDVAKPEAK